MKDYLTKNYHTHTPRCNHARGSEQEYIEQAIKSGLSVLGFSDHTPQPFKNKDFVPQTKMPVSAAYEYSEKILTLKDEYKDKIEIHLGVEAEYYPETFEALKELLVSMKCEYAILGQHYLNSDYEGEYLGRPCGLTEMKTYVERLTQGAQSGIFSYFCHPDLVNYQGDEKTYRDYMKEICILSNVYDLPLEINFLGLGDGRYYPSDRFFSIAAEYGCKVIYGIDAHTPESIGRRDVYQKAEAFREKYSLELVDTIDLKLAKLQ